MLIPTPYLNQFIRIKKIDNFLELTFRKVSPHQNLSKLYNDPEVSKNMRENKSSENSLQTLKRFFFNKSFLKFRN